MKFCVCLILLSLFCLISGEEDELLSEETQSVEITNPENIEDFVFKGEEKISGGHKLQIAKGRSARNGQFPYVAELAINTATGGYLCTASLISRNWLLTARHCAADKPVKSVRAALGGSDRYKPRVFIYVNNLRWMVASNGKHPDIALFRLSKNAPLSKTIQPIRLPSIRKTNCNYDGYTFTAIGWGQVAKGKYSRFLQYTQFKILPRSKCYLGPYLICSQPPRGTSQLLGGDSGGPAAIVERDGKETLIGVNVAYVTRGRQMWQATTRVTTFLRWIRAHTGVVFY